MRARLAAALGLLVALTLATASQAASQAGGPNGPAAPGLSSPNVSYVATIPTGAGVSARQVTVKGQHRLYVSSAHGLEIYDVSNPALPVPMGALPIYNWENEDMAVSADGSTVVLVEFDALLYLHVIDTSIPQAPVLKGTIIGDSTHTAECADPACHYLYGSNGATYDLRDRAHPVRLPDSKSWSSQVGANGGHALHRDAAGYWTSDETPIVVFRADNPLRPKPVATGDPRLDTAYQHNNIRPAADRYVPRKAGDTSSALRPGELLLTEGETNDTVSCDGGNGAFATWSMVGFEQGKPLKQLHALRPVSGDYTNGDPALNVLGCSGHWFTVREDGPGQYAGRYLVAAGWYEHGTRFLSVNPRTGTIKQVGYYQPVVGSASAAYWIGDTDYVYTVDYARGIDILRFDPSVEPPAVDPASWAPRKAQPAAQLERWLCRRSAQQRGQRAAQLGAALQVGR